MSSEIGQYINHVYVKRFRRMFLLVTPNETSFEKLEEVPNYVAEAVPYFFGLIVLEWFILLCQGKQLPRFNDSFSSLANGLLSLLHGLLFRGTELAAFMWVYERYNIITLPWDSPWTWIITLLGVDLGYYWVHRFGHEVNIMWAGHQTHHSSQEYNLTTALRQSGVHRYILWMFYMPLALFLPPSIFLVHIQFNLVYQFWVHTEIVDKLGPLEWIMSTPSHHRVHHGRNPYCIDKNYGGVFIIYDRIFGTFEPERDEDRPIYGLVHNLRSWNPIHAQFCHVQHIIKTAWNKKGLANKLSVICKGPGWTPGKPRMGLHSDIPEVESPVQKFDADLSWPKTLYVWLHFGLFLAVWHTNVAVNAKLYSTNEMAGNVLFVMFSLYVMGTLYDSRRYAGTLEFLRCVSYLVISQLAPQPLPLQGLIHWIYLASALIWGLAMALGSSKGQEDKKMK